MDEDAINHEHTSEKESMRNIDLIGFIKDHPAECIAAGISAGIVLFVTFHLLDMHFQFTGQEFTSTIYKLW